jgi:hypothetical protein
MILLESILEMIITQLQRAPRPGIIYAATVTRSSFHRHQQNQVYNPPFYLLARISALHGFDQISYALEIHFIYQIFLLGQ